MIEGGSPGVSVTTTWTVPTTTAAAPGVRTPPTQPPTTPPPGTPVEEQKCLRVCSAWTQWTDRCSQECGACGVVKRDRVCPDYADTCLEGQTRQCGTAPCTGGSPWLFANGEFHLLLDGCCIGKLKAAGVCGGLEESIVSFLKGFGLSKGVNKGTDFG